MRFKNAIERMGTLLLYILIRKISNVRKCILSEVAEPLYYS